MAISTTGSSNLIQRNLGRTEYMRTCKDVIDAYFQVKFRASVVSRTARMPAPAAQLLTSEQIEAANAVARLGALGTYLANLRDESVRVRYTELSLAVDKAVSDAGRRRLPRSKSCSSRRTGYLPASTPIA